MPIAPTQIAARRSRVDAIAPPSERAERDHAPDDEAHHRVHPALEPLGRDRLPVAALRDVVDRRRRSSLISREAIRKGIGPLSGASGISNAAMPQSLRPTTIAGPTPSFCANAVGSRSRRPGSRRCRSAKTRPIVPALRQVQLAHRVDEEDREHHVAEEVERGRRGCDPAQVPVAEDVAKTFSQLRSHARRGGPLARAGGHILVLANAQEEEARGDEAEGVEEDGHRRFQHLDQHARERRPGQLRAGARDLELRVAFDELVARHERREVRHVRDVEEHRQHAEDEADDVELPDRQRVNCVREGNRREQRRSTEICRR